MNYDAIILNGVSSSGKTSVAKCLQEKMAGNYLHFQLDAFWDMVPPTIEATSKNFPEMKEVVLETAVSFLRHKMPFIMDTVMMPKEYKKLLDVLKKHKVFYVAITANMAILEAREKARGDRYIGLSKSQISHIHKGCDYDLTVDTTQNTAENIADIILSKLSQNLR